MKELNKYTARAENFIKRYWDSTSQSLSDVYTTHSSGKAIAWKNCFEKYHLEDGYRFRIISHNSMQFTCGWLINGGDLRVETKDSSYIIKDIVLPF